MQWVNEKKEGQLFDFKYGKLYKTVVGIDKDWFPHRFRGERASQLVTETGINPILLLMKWFGWTSEKMPAHYARMSTKEIEEAYRRHEERAILGKCIMRAFQFVRYFYSLMDYLICIECQKIKDRCLCVWIRGKPKSLCKRICKTRIGIILRKRSVV